MTDISSIVSAATAATATAATATGATAATGATGISTPKRNVSKGGKRVSASEAALEEANLKIAHMERSIRFLKNQQTEVLQALHAEIDELKRKNKDLHIRLIVQQRGETAASK